MKPDHNQFVDCLDFMLSLQKLGTNESSSMGVPQFKLGVAKIVSLLRLSEANIDDCLPEFLTDADQFLETLAQNGTTEIRKRDLFFNKEAAASTSLTNTESTYGSEYALIFRMWTRFTNFTASCQMAVFTQLMGTHRCVNALQDYLHNTYDTIFTLQQSGLINIQANMLHFYGQKCVEMDKSCTLWYDTCKQMNKKITTKHIEPLSPNISSLVASTDGKQLRAKLRDLLPKGENLKHAVQRVNLWNENHLFELQKKWKEASALLLFFLYNLENSSSISSLENQFKEFIQNFDRQESALRKRFASIAKKQNEISCPLWILRKDARQRNRDSKQSNRKV